MFLSGERVLASKVARQFTHFSPTGKTFLAPFGGILVPGNILSLLFCISIIFTFNSIHLLRILDGFPELLYNLTVLSA
jgi:hypothetical protein